MVDLYDQYERLWVETMTVQSTLRGIKTQLRRWFASTAAVTSPESNDEASVEWAFKISPVLNTQEIKSLENEACSTDWALGEMLNKVQVELTLSWTHVEMWMNLNLFFLNLIN